MSHPIQFVSLGPGNPELITVQSLKALNGADVVFCPATKVQSRAEQMIRALGVETPLHRFVLPMSKQREAVMGVYDELFLQAQRLQTEGKRVAIAVEGDAAIYASMHYVLERLQAAGCEVEQLSGIPSFVAAGGEGMLHLVQQGERLVVIPGTCTAEELDGYLNTHHTVVIMKLSQCADVVKSYIAAHPTYAFHYFENVSTPQSVHLQCADEIQGREFPYFSLMIVKK